MTFIIFLVCLTASMIGSICGIGGGIIIKPVLDATGIMSVSAVSFLSKVTVLSMAAVSVFQRRGERVASDGRRGAALAVGALLGGLAGQAAFDAIRHAVGHDAAAGFAQALALMLLTLLTLWYVTSGISRIRPRDFRAFAPCCMIGAGIGAVSSFLGIGGGPFNLAALFLLCSMDTKEAAGQSLNIILLSQGVSLLLTLVRGEVPAFPGVYLPVMAAAGVVGGLLGTRLHRRLSEARTLQLFKAVLYAVVLISAMNAWNFFTRL